ncbi:DeoR/GlpR family DNA-binding transcription regulator [Breoghania corrubedonensis]|nr:DeoR/GlpR family DNA-binding transcription regulator [Breoghania corrubedonensis]
MTGRQTEIIALVRQNGFVSVDQLAEQFAVTPQTIRRDVNALCDANLLRRRHGGVENLDPTLNVPYDARRVTRAEAKRRIGAEVANLVPNRASVLIGIGTTLEMVAEALDRHEDLTVVTNNLNAAMRLSTSGSNRVFIPGGMLRLPDRDLLGAETETLFHSYRADFGIFGVGGIEPDGTLVDFDRAEVQAREAIRQSCRQAILVADRSKFGRPAPAHGGSLSDADIIVLDGPPEPDLVRLLDEAQADVRIAADLGIAGGDAL